ncbi:MAG: hypothetical protein AB2754_16040 [Candidatus Thiodiazotropha endolucinida]
MAGDWIKFEIATPDKPEIWAIAEDLEIDPDAAVGKLLRVWCWFDQHTEKGNAPSVTKMLLDRLVGVRGFCDSVVKAGWLIEKNGVLQVPNFHRHNGKTAKKRALTAKRVAKHKGNAKVTPGALPREEKSKEKINKKKMTMPEDFGISNRVKVWAEKKGFKQLEEHFENFVMKARAKGYKYVNWDDALMGAIRDDWANLRKRPATGEKKTLPSVDQVVGAQRY